MAIIKTKPYTLIESFQTSNPTHEYFNNSPATSDPSLWLRMTDDPVDLSLNARTTASGISLGAYVQTGFESITGFSFPTYYSKISGINSYPSPIMINTDLGLLQMGKGLGLGTDAAFSAGCWIYIDSDMSDTTGYIMTKRSALNEVEWYLRYNRANGRIEAALFTDNSNSIGRQTADSFVSFSTNTWFHVALTYDASDTAAGIKIYIDGVQKDTVDNSSGTYAGMRGTTASNDNFLIGDYNGFTTLKGSISELFVTKFRALSSDEINAIYFGSKNGQSTLRSGYMNLPPRVKLNQLDCMTGSYPTIARTGDRDRMGTYNVSFDDLSVIDFEQSVPVSYPSMLRSDKLQPYIRQKLDMPSKYVNSTLVATGNMNPGTTDAGIHFTPGEDISPFNDSLASEATMSMTGQFYATGTANVIYPGFTSPLRDKIRIDIDITPTREQIITKATGRRMSSGPYAGQDLTGFCYYNWDLKRWDQIGIVDPSTGNDIYFDYAVEAMESSPGVWSSTHIKSGSENFPNQFISRGGFYLYALDEVYGNYDPITPTSDQIASEFETWGLENMATPIINSCAPWGTKYHATSSQTLAMSNYISQPFLVEKVIIDASVNAQVVLNSSDDQVRNDITDYVFFMYLQQDNTTANDSALHVSSSNRYIMLSGSACFYNPNLYNATYGVLSYEPIHTPAFSYPFNVANDGTAATVPSVGSFTGSISLEIRPASPSPNVAGMSAYPAPDNPTGVDAMLQVPGVWPGGASVIPFVSSSESMLGGKTSLETVEYGKYGYQIRKQGVNSPIVESSPSIGTLYSVQINTTRPEYDSRHFLPYGGIPAVSAGGTVNLFSLAGGSSSVQSPFILFPNDTIVLGVEKATNPPRRSSSGMTGDYGYQTGSHITMLPSGSKITLFGSLLRDGKQLIPGLNQNLTSDAIHEVIHELYVDQFEIGHRKQYTGSYESMYRVTPASSNAQGVGTLMRSYVGVEKNLGTARVNRVTTASFNRFVKMFTADCREYPFPEYSINGEETYLDSYVPEIKSMMEINMVNQGQNIDANITWYLASSFAPLTGTAWVGGHGRGPALSGLMGDQQAYGDQDWFKCFPFEGKYADVPRVQGFGYGTAMSAMFLTCSYGNAPPYAAAYLPGAFVPIASPPGVIEYSGGSHGLLNVGGTGESNVRNALFMVGTGPSGSCNAIVGVEEEPGGLQRLIQHRGYKYGLRNANVEASCVYTSNNHYGQFRDFIEYRQFSNAKYGPPGNKSWMSTNQVPVSCEFVVPSVDTDGNQTGWITLLPIEVPDSTYFSSNISPLMTSSLPFFDAAADTDPLYPSGSNRNYPEELWFESGGN